MHNHQLKTEQRKVLQKRTHKKRRQLENHQLKNFDDNENFILPEKNSHTEDVWFYD